MGLITKLSERVALRKPDFVIGADHPEGAYMLRWYVLPRNRFLNLYLHCFLRSDENFALHDHPWLFNVSRLLSGMYVEHTIEAGGVNKKTFRAAGDWKFRWGKAPHRVELFEGASCWTFFLTGPVVRTWGFHCPKGWISFKEKITRTNDSSTPRLPCP